MTPNSRDRVRVLYDVADKGLLFHLLLYLVVPFAIILLTRTRGTRHLVAKSVASILLDTKGAHKGCQSSESIKECSLADPRKPRQWTSYSSSPYPYSLSWLTGRPPSRTAKMSNTASQHVLYRMVPLICQALHTSPTDETVWLEGLGLLSNPKLRRALSTTSSIWFPLLLKGLDTSRSKTVIMAALTLLAEVTETLQPMRSCLVKPLRELEKDEELGDCHELVMVREGLGFTVSGIVEEDLGKMVITVRLLLASPKSS